MWLCCCHEWNSLKSFQLWFHMLKEICLDWASAALNRNSIPSVRRNEDMPCGECRKGVRTEGSSHAVSHAMQELK